MTTYPAAPPLECDLVMKGGITSGVIYPGTVCELAKTYRFRSVGGASAGAIAAAATAAAELGRQAGGFERLETLPTRLTETGANGRSTLFNLFRPEPSQRRPFAVLSAHMLQPGRSVVAVTIFAALARYGVRAILGCLTAALVLIVGLLSGNVWGVVAGLLGALVTAALLVPLFVGLGIFRDLRGMQRFGLCSGMSGSGDDQPAPLTPWLHQELQALAGLDPQGTPLTFGQLSIAGVELRMMTTNLTRGQPMTLPWTNREYYFDPIEFRQLFPEEVVRWMEDHPPALTGAQQEQFRQRFARLAAEPRLPFPDVADLPVLVATRMSLSFPGLIQAVPLYAVDWTDPDNQKARTALDNWRRDNPPAPGIPPQPADALDDQTRMKQVVNWFSDGGICANMPVHMFDSPLPTRPTFAVNLAAFGPARPRRDDEAENCYLPQDTRGGRFLPWRDLGDGSGTGLPGFLSTLVDTARSWVDNQQMTMPAYRGRVVTIFHDQDEGGMNLNMAADVVSSLAARGKGAGAALNQRFAGPRPGKEEAPGWTVHRWTRMRISLAGHQDWSTRFARAFRAPAVGAPYPGMFDSATAAPPAYPSTKGRREQMGRLTTALVNASDAWTPDVVLDDAPERLPRLRLTTELDETQAATKPG